MTDWLYNCILWRSRNWVFSSYVTEETQNRTIKLEFKQKLFYYHYRTYFRTFFISRSLIKCIPPISQRQINDWPRYKFYATIELWSSYRRMTENYKNAIFGQKWRCSTHFQASVEVMGRNGLISIQNDTFFRFFPDRGFGAFLVIAF